MGRHPASLTPPALPSALLPASLDAALQLAESANPLIVRAVYEQEAARRAKREAYGALLPTVSLELSHGVEHETSASIDKEEESSVFVRMKMPLYKGGDSYSRIRETRARESGAAYEVTDTRRRTRASVIDAWKQFHAAQSRIRAANQQVRAARDALRGVQIEVKVGERALFEVLDAQRELVNGEVALARARRDHVVAGYTLLAVTGRLTARHLHLPAAYPDRNAPLRKKNPKVVFARHGTGGRPAPSMRLTPAAQPVTAPRTIWTQTVEGPQAMTTTAAGNAGYPHGLRTSLPPN